MISPPALLSRRPVQGEAPAGVALEALPWGALVSILVDDKSRRNIYKPLFSSLFRMYFRMYSLQSLTFA